MAAPDNSNNVKNWLVKSSTKILGPFTRDEVVQLLSRRQITIIDEIRQPDLRWNYIRETRYFKEIVKNLRFEDDHSREDTMTSTSTAAGTMTKTDNGAMLIDDLTPAPQFPSTSVATSDQALGMRDVTPSQDTKNSFKSSGPAKSFGNLQDQRVQSRIQRQNFVLRSILLVILVGGLLYASFAFLGKDKKTDLNFDQLMASALKYKELGLYQKSLGFYRKASALKEVDLESQFQMVFVLINEDRQSLKGRRIIERALLKENRTRQEIVTGNLGMGLAFLMEGDLRQAEDYFQKTLGLDANNEAAKLNLAVIQLKKGVYAQAFKSFEALTRGDSSGYPLILIGKTIALIEMSKLQPDKE
ncbi:MAG: tetratricopeptide repeat protein, partial [Bdellovibrionaceae bacterium]|nr:tetratricopeptide repeat protein [Pseudobdellovibrionaceae bacterium]